MKHGFTDNMWKKKNAAFTMCWKKFAETEKGAAGQVEHESHVDVFF
jgi:hypothetical protein